MASRRKAVGSIGSSFATVGDEKLPCVPKRWWPAGKPFLDPGAKQHEPFWIDFAVAIEKAGKVILTDDEWKGDKLVRRLGYIAIYGVEGVTLDERGLSFRVIRNIEPLQ